MRRRASVFLAIASAVALLAAAATRPRYGGTLHVQLAGPLPRLSPPPEHPDMRERAFIDLVYETLVRLNARGEPEPLLATAWEPDPDRKRWRISLRTGVTLHDGSAFTPAVAAAALGAALKTFSAANVTSGQQGIQISSERPMPDLLDWLAGPAAAFPTGPFRTEANAGGSMTLAAFEPYWGGRPFIDSIELLPGRAGAPVPSTADVWEIAPGTPARAIPERTQIWSSAPSELLAIENSSADPVLASQLSAAIDRSSMAAVLTQKRAEPTAAVLPQWISGYAFVFSKARDLEKARGVNNAPVVLTYEPSDALARSVAERVAVNARDAGLSITPRAGAAGALKMRRFALDPNGAAALNYVAARLGLGERFVDARTDPEAVYAAERRLLATGKLVPLMHIPLLFGFQADVHLPPFAATALPRPPFDSCWMAP